MASKGKESTNVKERRGLSPSNPRPAGTTPTQRRLSPSPSPRGITDQKQTPASSERHVPNYLRPTKSSGTDHSSTPGKKQAPTNTSTKPTLQRKGSFDKPPSPSGPRKAQLSSGYGARNPQPASPSPRTTLTPKTHSERSSSRAPKEFGKSLSLGARSVGVKKSPNTIEKQFSAASTAAATTKPPSVIADVTDHPGLEPQQVNSESSVPEAEVEVVKVESHDELLTEIPVVEEKKHVEHVQTESVIEKVEELKGRETPNVSEHHIAAPAAQIKEVPLDEVHVDETSISHDGEGEDSGKDESEKILPEENFAGESKVEVEDEDGEEDATENSKGKVLDETEADGVMKPKERDGSEGGPEEVKPVAENSVTKHQTVQSKKDTQAYNDVIEETASKLLEKRKNKVKALVGAFETVISLQEPEA